LDTLIGEIRKFNPDICFFNHHSEPYDDFLKALDDLSCKRILYFSAPISLERTARNFDAFIVHHEYQKTKLINLGINSEKIDVAPKMTDFDVFYDKKNPVKKWDCIYPSRGGFGYWKRIELAVGACALAGATLCCPGSSIPNTMGRPPARNFPLSARIWPAYFYKNMLRKYKKAKKNPDLDAFPWVETLPWQSTEQMVNNYNQSRCMIITSDENEMGPRVIPEAAACNLPVVVCSDSPSCVSHARKIGGFIAEPDIRDIADKIRMALSLKTVHSREYLLEAGFDTWTIYRALKKRIGD